MTDTGACPGPCNTGWRKARAAYKTALAAYDPLNSSQTRPEPFKLQPVPPAPDSGWCADCAAKIRAQLADLDELAAQLAWHADGHATSLGSAAGRVSGSAEVMSPSEAGDELADLMGMLGGWEMAYREHHHLPSPPRRGYLALASSQCIAWLGTHLDGILASPIGEDFGREVAEWYWANYRRVKAGQPRRKKPIRCPGCRARTLVWQEGGNRVTCQNPDGCNRVFTLAEYEALEAAAVAALDEGRAAPAA